MPTRDCTHCHSYVHIVQSSILDPPPPLPLPLPLQLLLCCCSWGRAHWNDRMLLPPLPPLLLLLLPQVTCVRL
jgi:hypothetical protein